MVSIGLKLKKAREDKSIALDQVQKHTHIHFTVLAALEEGRCDEILTPTYVKSFLKKYAAYLGLDSGAIVKEYSAIHPEDALRTQPVDRIDQGASDIVSRIMYAVSIIIILIIALWVLVFFGNKILNAVKGRNKPAQASPRLIKPKPALKAAPKIVIPKKEPIKLILKTKAKVYVKLKKDGVLLFARVLPKGTVETFIADDKLELYLAKAEAVELILNGKSIGSPGRGVIKSLEITRSGIKR